MLALVWVAASTVAAWIGIEVYDNLADLKEIINACEIIVR